MFCVAIFREHMRGILGGRWGNLNGYVGGLREESARDVWQEDSKKANRFVGLCDFGEEYKGHMTRNVHESERNLGGISGKKTARRYVELGNEIVGIFEVGWNNVDGFVRSFRGSTMGNIRRKMGGIGRVMLEDLGRSPRGMRGKKIARRFVEVCELGEEYKWHTRR